MGTLRYRRNKPALGIAVFSKNNINFGGEDFDGAKFISVFGNLNCDLTDAKIENDCVIKSVSVFGKINIKTPQNINVKIKSSSVFGGIGEKSQRKFSVDEVTAFVEGVGIFGGIHIK